MTEIEGRTQMNFKSSIKSFTLLQSESNQECGKLFKSKVWFVSWAPLTFHGDQTGVRQQRQGEQKQEIHHWQTSIHKDYAMTIGNKGTQLMPSDWT